MVACRDRQTVPPCRRGYVAVLDRHALAGSVEGPFLIGPDVCDGHVEPVYSSLERVHKPRQRGLAGLDAGVRP
jgi:hypothetical protein